MATKKERGEQEAHVLAVRKRCRGVHLVREKEQRSRFDAWTALEDSADLKGASVMISNLVEAANKHTKSGFVVSEPIYTGDEGFDDLRRIAFPLIRLRGDKIGQGCGWDLNEEILKHPFDGAEHLTTCPNCGIEMSWKAPVFEA